MSDQPVFGTILKDLLSLKQEKKKSYHFFSESKYQTHAFNFIKFQKKKQNAIQFTGKNPD